MDEKNECSEKPRTQQIRHLGLRRTIKRDFLKTTSAVTQITPTSKESTPAVELPTTSKKSLMNSPADTSATGSLSASKLETVLSTPCSSASKRPLLITDCRPYRLSLSKSMREKLAKKRLDFKIPNDLEVNSEAPVVEVNKKTDPSLDISKMHDMSRKELIVEIEKRRAEIEAHEVHERKVRELKNAIEVWKRGFRETFCDLHAKLEPKIEKSELLQKLGMSPKMLRYVIDEDECEMYSD